MSSQRRIRARWIRIMRHERNERLCVHQGRAVSSSSFLKGYYIRIRFVLILALHPEHQGMLRLFITTGLQV